MTVSPGAAAGRAKAARASAQAAPRAVARDTPPADRSVELFRASPLERARIVKKGVPASYVVALTDRMAMPKEKFYRTVGLARATVDRKVRGLKLLNPDESERVVGFMRLVGQTETLVRESGSSVGFDAAKWLAGWLDRPLPALGGRAPAEFMDTADGRAMVADLMAQQQSGAYG